MLLQVTGELSNNGQPMRRFMQTFVLAPQSPKKYYVHNDIFRYQDEVFHDLEGEGDVADESIGESVIRPHNLRIMYHPGLEFCIVFTAILENTRVPTRPRGPLDMWA